MANLADIEVELSLDMSGFNRDLAKAQKEINSTSRRLSRDSNYMSKQFRESFGDIGRGFDGMGGYFDRFSKRSIHALQLTEHDLKGLPDHLKPLAFQANSVGNSVEKSFGHMGKTFKHLQNDLQYSTVKMNDFGKASDSVKKPIKTLNDVRDKATRAKFAMMGLNENGKVRISTAESEKRINEFHRSVAEARKEMQRLDVSGKSDTAREGMRQLAEASNDVNRTFQAVGRGGDDLNRVFRNMGIMTQDMSDSVAMSMERMKAKVLRSHDMLMQKSTQAQNVMKLTDGIKYYGVSRQLLKLGDSLEKRAREGTALNLALKRVGKDAPFAKIADETKKIQAGIGRLPTYVMGMGIAAGLATYGMIELSNAIDGRLKPAFEDLKSAWAGAMKPFTKAFTTALVKVIEFGTHIGELAKKFGEVHPQLSAMIGGFIYLTLVFSLLLAPLAVGIGLTGGLAASFAALWAVIAPFVIAFLTVVGVAMLVAAAVVVVVAVINNMWKASEKFRDSVKNAWASIKDAIAAAIEPIKAAWENLKSSFTDLITKMTGGEAKSAGDFWTWLGDKVSVFVDWMSSTFQPLLAAVFTAVGETIARFIDVISFLVDIFSVALPYIIPIVQETFQTIGDLITGVIDVITGIMEAFHALFTGDWDALWEAVKKITSGAWEAVWAYFKLFAGGKLLGLIGKFASGILGKVINAFTKMKSGTIEKVKSMGSSISNKFGEIKKWLSDKAKGAYEAVLKAYISMKNKVTNSVKSMGTAISNKFGDMKKSVGDKVRSLVDAAGKKFSDMKSKLTKYVGDAKTSVVNKFNDMKTSAVNKAKDILSGVADKFSSLKDKITNPINTAKDKVLGIVDKIKSAFNGMKLSFPKISLPSLTIGKTSKTIMGKEFSVPTFGIKWNAKGAIFDGASILGGGQGVGEAGAEAVIPIQHKRYMKPFADAVAQNLGTNKEKDTPAQVIYQIDMSNAIIREEADVQKIVNELERRRKVQERTKGIVSFG